jgi:hypothetical protein
LRLVDLKPKWMRLDGEAVAIIFLCPRCVSRGNGCSGKGLTWLTCTFAALGNREQRELIEATILREPADFAATGIEEHDVVGCKRLAWKRTSKLLETMSVTPSLDASKSGHWHGHIKGGAIVGGI